MYPQDIILYIYIGGRLSFIIREELRVKREMRRQFNRKSGNRRYAAAGASVFLVMVMFYAYYIRTSDLSSLSSPSDHQLRNYISSKKESSIYAVRRSSLPRAKTS